MHCSNVFSLQIIYLTVFCVINLSLQETVLPSDEIWEEIVKFIDYGIIIKKSDFYLFFDELNYTKLEVNSTKMNYLSEVQHALYLENGISNYIFVIEDLDETVETIEKFTDNLFAKLEEYIRKELSNFFIAVFVMKTHRVRIKLGEVTHKKISDYDAEEIIAHLGNYLRSEDYYKAWLKLLNDIGSYYKNEKPGISDIAIVLIVIGCIFVFYLIGGFAGWILEKCGCISLKGYNDNDDYSSWQRRSNSWGRNNSYGGGGGCGGGATGTW